MNLFVLNSSTYEIDISPEALLLKPFYKILARDRSKFKKKAKAELAYIWFMYDFKSDYMSNADEFERSIEIIDTLDGLPDGYKPDKLVLDACEFYKDKSKTIASTALANQMGAVNSLMDKIESFMNSNDASVVDKAVKFSERLISLILNINSLEKIVKGEQDDKSSSHRGNQEKSMMEDG